MDQASNVIYIAGSGRTGSTILDVILGNHPKIVGLGEIHRLSIEPDIRKCGCGTEINNCEFWNPLLKQISNEKKIPFENWWDFFPLTLAKEKKIVKYLPSLLEILLMIGNKKILKIFLKQSLVKKYFEIIENSLFLYDKISKYSDVPYIIDSTKNPVRMKALYLSRPNKIKIILIVRDGRAIVASAKRRIKTPIEVGTTNWVTTNKNLELMLRTISKEKYIVVRYEDLCDDTENIFRKITSFIGIDYDPKMLRPVKGNFHQIPGNPWLHNNDDDVIEIKKDERWKTELTKDELRIFNNIGSSLNKKFGYR
ncbi:MAG: sulfotransferase [Arcobacter sp.]|nr:sulfotransferase [Arcobacter sp.]